VYFGTGKYLEPTDDTRDDQATQSFYAIWDDMSGHTVLTSELVQQSILSEETQGFDTDGDFIADTTYNTRITTDNPITWKNQETILHRGWYMDLSVPGQTNDQGEPTNQGERIISRPILRNGRVIFTTLIPPASLCEFNSTSWLMELDAATGGRLSEPSFDLNEDGKFDAGDQVNSSLFSEPVTATGIQSTVGATGTPSVLVSEDKSAEFKVLSGTGGLTTIRENPGSATTGRQSWRQMR